eukprot:TRINITY_DN5760_c0_g2_i1.p1 TRINITY_DN5760_c0_g2~~TRINITY_DN5760_c0_g2_i1.p1  ORF type:complete len:273 (+),score=71.42 TRINITY_DN5760_c0_g2_i1:647-1465(+)
MEGFSGYLGGLSARTGPTSVFRKVGDVEIMFHISTLLPFSKSDAQQIDRKRHIGNDNIVVVFQDGDCSSSPYATDTMASRQTQVLIVVSPCDTTVTPSIVVPQLVTTTEDVALGLPQSAPSSARADDDTTDGTDNTDTPLLGADETTTVSQPVTPQQGLAPTHLLIDERDTEPALSSSAAPTTTEEPTAAPEYTSDEHAKPHFKVAVARRSDVPEFGPALTATGVYSAVELTAFLQAKLLNAQRAVALAREFEKKREQVFTSKLEKVLKQSQ